MNPSGAKTQKTSSTGLNVGTWMPAEDEKLKEAVAKHGTRWVVVASEVGTRNGDQCAKRWNENLNPDLDHSPWCAVEVGLLIPYPLFAILAQSLHTVANHCCRTRIDCCCISLSSMGTTGSL